MRIHISLDYFDWIDEYFSPSKEPFDTEKFALLHKLKIFFRSFPAYFDCSNEEFTAFRKTIENEVKGAGKFSPKFFLFQAIIGNGFVSKPKKDIFKEIECLNGFYFTLDSSFSTTALAHGVISKDRQYPDCQLFDKFNAPNVDFDNVNFTSILPILAPSNCLLIIDKYMLIQPNIKLQHLINFISKVKGKTEIPLHVTLILCNHIDKKKKKELPDDILKNCIEVLKRITGVVFQIIIDNNEYIHDRLIFTNYLEISIGIPFQPVRFPTKYTQKFLASASNEQMVSQNYEKQIEKLSFFFRRIQNAERNPDQNLRCIYPKEKFQNRIFDVFSVPTKRIPIVLRDQRS